MSDYVIYISCFSVLLPVVAGLVNYSVLPGALRIFLAGLIIHFVLDFYSLRTNSTNAVLFDLVLFNDLFMISIAFYLSSKNRNFKALILLLTTLWTVGYLISEQIFTGYFNEAGIFVYCVITIVFCILYFKEMISAREIQMLHKQPMFWISSGALVAVAGFSVVPVFGNYLWEKYHDQDMFYKFYQIPNVANIIGNAMYAFAMSCLRMI